MPLRMRLEWRVGALMSTLVAGLVLAGIGAVWVRTYRLAGPAMDQSVLRARDLVEEALAARLDRLDLVTRLLTADTPFKAYVAEDDLPSTLDNLSDRSSMYACDAFVITDAGGVPIVDTRRPDGTPQPPDPLPPLLEAALRGEPARGVWVETDERLYLAAAAPFDAGRAAALVALEEVDGALASALRQATGADLAFFTGPAGSPHPGATTLALSRSQLATFLATSDLAAGGTPRRVEVDGEGFAALAAPIAAAGSQAPAGYVAMRSVDRELASFRKIQAALLIVGLAAIPLALLLGALFARRITRPIAVLVRATERVRAGDYNAPLPPETGDEVGVLAGAFRMMVAQLKEKEEMDAWIGALASRVAASAPASRASAESDRLPTGMETRDVGSSSARSARQDPPVGHLAAPGRLLQNRFRILSRLGSGGMGTVWKARDERLGEFVAIKILPAEVMMARPDMIERFRQEILLARRVTHRNVLRTHELLELEGAWAILMEWVDGVPLDRILEEGRLPVAAGLRIARQICAGLEAAHAQGVVHRDLKPGNVLVDSSGVVKIADFGLARASDSADGLTRDGTLMGTPHYMSPEQALGRTADLRSDVYSAGVLFYEILCGRRPFAADSALALLRAHTDATPPPPSAVNPALGPALEAVLLRALDKEPARRFASARELSDALAQAAAGGAAA